MIFKTFSDYREITKNSKTEQAALKSLDTRNFKSLRTKKENATTSRTNRENFDTSLYTQFMLDVLNDDKIFTLNGFYVKIDMENSFCSFIDATLYPNEYNDLKNNNFSNTHIHTFVNELEPALDVLEQIRSGEITWEGYQDLLARKWQPLNICLRAGDRAQISYINGNSLFMYYQYITNFLHFELKVASRESRYNTTYLQYTYSFETACGDASSGEVSINNADNPYNIIQSQIYSGGKALRYTQIIGTGKSRLLTSGAWANNLSLRLR